MPDNLKVLFLEEFTVEYREYLTSKCDCGNKDIVELLFMAFCNGYEKAKKEME